MAVDLTRHCSRCWGHRGRYESVLMLWDRHSQTTAYSLTEVSIRNPAGRCRGPKGLHKDPLLLPHPNSHESGCEHCSPNPFLCSHSKQHLWKPERTCVLKIKGSPKPLSLSDQQDLWHARSHPCQAFWLLVQITRPLQTARSSPDFHLKSKTWTSSLDPLGLTLNALPLHFIYGRGRKGMHAPWNKKGKGLWVIQSQNSAQHKRSLKASWPPEFIVH